MLIPNALLLSFVWLPPSLGFARVYPVFPWTVTTVSLVAISVALTLFIQTTATTLAWLAGPLVRTYRRTASWIFGAGAIGLSYLILQSILPSSLRALLRIDIDQFSSAFTQLPLNQPWFVSRWLLYPLTGENVLLFGMTLVDIVLLTVGLIAWQTAVFRRIYAAAQSVHAPTTRTIIHQWYQAPQLWREIIAFLRTKSETNFFFLFHWPGDFLFSSFYIELLRLTQSCKRSLRVCCLLAWGPYCFSLLRFSCD